MELSHEGGQVFSVPARPATSRNVRHGHPTGCCWTLLRTSGFFCSRGIRARCNEKWNIRLATGGLRDGKSRRCPSPSLPPGPHYRERHPQVAHYIGLFSGIRRCSRQTLWQAVPWRSSLRVGAARNFHGGASHIAPNPTPRKGVTAIVLRIRLRRYCGISDKKNSGGCFSNARRVWRTRLLHATSPSLSNLEAFVLGEDRCLAHQSFTRSALIVSFGPTMRLTAWPSSNCAQASFSAASLVG
jgi:hypothetical protein